MASVNASSFQRYDMSKFKTRIPQASRGENPESRTDTSVSPVDSGGGKLSIDDKKRRSKLEETLYVGTYNIRTMRLDEHLSGLEHELQNIKWDVIGISETRLSGEAVTILKSGHLLFQKNSDTNSHIGGVALLVHKKKKHLVTKTRAVSNRVIYVMIRINAMFSIQIIQAYAPTSASSDEEIEQFYEDLTTAKNAGKTKICVIIGDFNAKVGAKVPTDPSFIGKFGLGARNQRGQTMIDFLNKERLYCMNTFYKKHPKIKWTWNPQLCSDVSVLNRFDTGSDHRLV